MTDELTLFDLHVQADTVCLWPDHAATTGYSRGCRCERCLDARRGQTVRAKSGMCNIEGCDNRRMKGRSYCIEHVPLAPERKRRTKAEATCELCGTLHGWYESNLEWNIRPDLQDLYRRTCKDCRGGYMGAIQNHSLDTTLALRLISATHCELCHQRFGAKSGRRKSIVDHDHECCRGVASCGRCVRGIVCHTCNGRLGVVDLILNDNALDDVLNYIAASPTKRGVLS